MDSKCFQYAVTVVLNYENLVKDLQWRSKFKLFIDQYDLEEVSFPSHQKDWKMSETNDKTICC